MESDVLEDRQSRDPALDAPSSGMLCASPFAYIGRGSFCPPGSDSGSGSRPHQSFEHVGDGPSPAQQGSIHKRRPEQGDIDPLPAAKRSRLAQTGALQPAVGDNLNETPVQQPTPQRPHRPSASFLKDYVDSDRQGARPRSLQASISEWLESLGSDREKQCRSDSYISRSEGDNPVPGRYARSAPEMDRSVDADGFAIPRTPPSTRGRSRSGGPAARSVGPSDAASGSRSGGKSLVETLHYRNWNLHANGILMRPAYETFPEDIDRLVRQIGEERSSPGPILDHVERDAALLALEEGAEETDVESYFEAAVFPKPGPLGDLKLSERHPMSRHAVPGPGAGSGLRVSNPVPDLLYGYRDLTFPEHAMQLHSMDNVTANSQGLLYPFFAIDFKGDGPGGTGSLWVATNQCLGSSAACVNLAERLNELLRRCSHDQVLPIDSAAFSIAMNGTEARLYVSWKHSELDFYTRKIRTFVLQDPQHFLDFRRHVRNIVDWGEDGRLKAIRRSLDALLEEGRKRASAAAKARAPPSGGIPQDNGKGKRRQASSRPKGGLGSAAAEEDEYWDWDDATGAWFHRNADGSVIWADKE